MPNEPTAPVWRARPIAWRLKALRGHPKTFDKLVSRMAESRTCQPGGGGSWSGDSGDGKAWHKTSDRFGGDNAWCRWRQIKRGQFIGPWHYQKVGEI